MAILKKIITDKIKTILQSPLFEQSILIKADGRSSLARIIDVWNVCRELGLEKLTSPHPCRGEISIQIPMQIYNL